MTKWTIRTIGNMKYSVTSKIIATALTDQKANAFKKLCHVCRKSSRLLTIRRIRLGFYI